VAPAEGKYHAFSAQEAPIYVSFGDSRFAEDQILNPRLLSNGKSNAGKSEFRAFDFGRYWAGFRAFDYSTLAIIFPEEISSIL